MQTAVVKQTVVGLPVHASDRLRPVKPVGSGGGSARRVNTALTVVNER